MSPITAVYAAIFSLIYVALSLNVIGNRRRVKIALGQGDHCVLLRAIRVHGNFSEYVPLSLILMLLSEQNGGPAILIHIAASTLLAGRLIHAYGVSQANENYRFRVAGMALTFTAITLLALLCLLGALPRLG